MIVLPELSMRGRLGLLAVLALALVVNLASLDQWHGDGPDFAQYLHHTRNLLEGTPYGQGQYFGHPIKNYPPAYPLMLLPIMAVKGMDLAWFKALNIVVWLGICLLAFAWAHRRLGPGPAFCLLAFLAFSPWVFYFKNKILSDLSFAFFALAGLAAFDRAQKDAPPRWGLVVLAMALMAWAMLLRTVGFTLFGAVGLYYLIVRRDLKAAFLPGIVMLAVVALQSLTGTSTGGYFSVFPPREVFLERLAWGWAYNLGQAANFHVGGLFNIFKDSLGIWLQIILGAPATALALWGLRVDWARRGLAAEHLFALLYFVVICIYPYREGIRYILPVAVLMLLYTLMGLKDLVGRLAPARPGLGLKLTAGVLVLGLAVNIAGLAMVWQRQEDYLYSRHMRQLAAWLQANTKPDDHYLTRFPRVVSLFSRRTGVMGNEALPLETWLATANERGLRFLIFRQERDTGLIKAARANPKLRQVFANPIYVVFERLP